jgi:hypothetical protein
MAKMPKKERVKFERKLAEARSEKDRARAEKSRAEADSAAAFKRASAAGAYTRPLLSLT